MAITDAQLIQIENEALSLNARADRIEAQINDYVSTVNTSQDPASQLVSNGKALEAEAVDTLARLNQFNNSPAVNEVRAYGDLREQQRVNNVLEVIRRARSRTDTALTDVRSTLAGIGTAEPSPSDATNSAAQIVGDGATNRTENATVQNPETETEQGQLATETPSNADGATTRGLADFEDAENNAVEEDSNAGAPTSPTLEQGVDGIQVAQGYNKEIVTRKNVLSQFGTSTYGITIYLLTPGQYNKMIGYSDEANPREQTDSTNQVQYKSVEGFQAILSSGGMPNGFTGDPYTVGGATRNRFFNLDYFIDDLEIETLMPQQVRGATNVTQLSFRITEPYGFTFLNRLKNASEDLMANFAPEASTGAKDWIRQHYLMVIRFYGQEDGVSEFVPGQLYDTPDQDKVEVITDKSNLLIDEKYIPFQFTNITTKASTGAVEYLCSAVPINQMQAMGQKTNTVKYQVEIQGQTLDDLFNGKLSQTVDTSGGRVLSTGLVESINAYYKTLENSGVIGKAPEFEVNFLGGIGEQKVKAPGSTKKNRTAMAKPGSFNPELQSMQKEIINFSINAGSQIQQVLDTTIRSSEWITKQQKKYIDSNDRKVRDKASNKILQWYRITSHTKVLGWDDIRKDYAHKTTYQVIPTSVGDVKSPFFPRKRFNGCQKRYKYWFTGENTEILDYELDFNALYYVSSSPLVAQDRDSISTIGEMTNPGPPDQSIVGGSDQSADPAARAASVLYSPADYAILNMKILGDPFYIQQGDIFWRSYGIQDRTPGYLPDGSADFESGEVLLEVDYQTMEDYDEDTGMADVRPIELKDPQEIANTTTTSGNIYKGLIYQVTQVNNNFSKGVFTQDIQGVLKQYTGEYEGVDVRQEPEITPTNNVNDGPKVDYSNEVVIPSILQSQQSTSQSAPQRVTPVLGGLSLGGASFVAPDDDAS